MTHQCGQLLLLVDEVLEDNSERETLAIRGR